MYVCILTCEKYIEKFKSHETQKYLQSLRRWGGEGECVMRSDEFDFC